MIDCEHCEDLKAALQRIAQWSKAYPTDIFHEPSAEESQRAHKLLLANGMTLDAFSASASRHCFVNIGKIAEMALADIARAERLEHLRTQTR